MSQTLTILICYYAIFWVAHYMSKGWSHEVVQNIVNQAQEGYAKVFFTLLFLSLPFFFPLLCFFGDLKAIWSRK